MHGVVDREVERTIIGRCLRFDAFNRFYQNEFLNKNISIKCIINSTCLNFAAQLFDRNGNPYIEIRKIPETVDDVFLVAHEMGHAIKYFNNQYLFFDRAQTPIAQIYIDNEIIDMGCKLGSMLDDPLIDSFLKDKYDFDPAHFYITMIIPDLDNSLNQYGDPSYEWHIFKKALLYTQLSLQINLINDVESRKIWDGIKEKYKIRRPLTARIGEDLYSMANEYGYDIKEKQINLFNKIFNKYTIRRDDIHRDKLSDIVRVLQ